MRKRFLMCRPDFFDVEYLINPWMDGNIHQVNKTLAVTQWETLYNIVSKYADVELIDPVDGLPDMVFTANAGLPILGTESVIISSFYHLERQPEENYFHRWFCEHGFHVAGLPCRSEGLTFEGAGDALVDITGSYWMACGSRSSEVFFQSLKKSLPQLSWHQLELATPDFYHLDTCFAPLSKGHVLFYPGAFTEKSVNQIWDDSGLVFMIGVVEGGVASYNTTPIVISESDANQFAANVIDIDGVLIAHGMSTELVDLLEGYGYTVILTNLSEFLKAGGGAKCLVLPLN